MAWKIKAWWDYIQQLLDLDGDVWMGAFTLVILIRLVLVLKGYPAMTTSEAGTFGSAILAFAYSNRKPPTA